MEDPSATKADTDTNTKDANSSSSAENPSSSSAHIDANPPFKISKSQMKKRKRYEKLQEVKKRKKQQAKDRKIAKAKAEGRDLDAERKLQLERERSGEGKKRRDAHWQAKLEESRTNETFQICIDCGFEDLMTFKEQNSLAGQIRYCYAQNRRSENPVRMSVAGLKKEGPTYEQMAKVHGFPEQWFTRAFMCSSEPLDKMHCKPATSTSKSDEEKDNRDEKQDDLSHIIYLSSDAEYTLDHLDDDKVYVIGGIVDRNRLKGTTEQKAQALGIKTAKLPIEEYLKLVATKVLTVNHVFDILLKYRTHGNDWKKALLDVLPARKDITDLSKEGTLLESANDGSSDNKSEN